MLKNCNTGPIKNISVLVVGSSSDSKHHLQEMLKDQSVTLTFAGSVQEAKQCILQDTLSLYDAYLFDNSQYYEDNLMLLKALKKNGQYAVVPVIFQADIEDMSLVQQGLQHGVYFYLLKPYTQEFLLSVLKAAVTGFDHQQALSQNLTALESSNGGLESKLQVAKFHIKTVEDAKSLSCTLAFIAPKPKEVALGLFELMTNAIEHGSLNISYQEKTHLIQANCLQAEINHRQKLPKYCKKIVTVEFERKPNFLQFTIRDMGEGFDYIPYLDFSVERAMDSHGRGVMIANKLSFDELFYEDNGCTVVGRVFN